MRNRVPTKLDIGTVKLKVSCEVRWLLESMDNILLEDDVAQRVTQSMVFIQKLKGRRRFCGTW
jgi:hypothetical protein